MDRKRIVKGVIATVLAVSCIVSTAFAAQPSDFKDYDPNAWYAEAAEFVVTNNIMAGTDAGTLEMNRTITRAEFVSLMDRLFMTYNKADLSKYTDMERTQWFYDNIAMGLQMGTIAGTSDTTITPNGYLTREMVITILARTLALEDGTVADLAKFKDNSSVSQWALPTVSAFARDERVHGYNDGTLKPTQYITRGETAQLLMNCFRTLSSSTDIKNTTDDNIFLLRSGKDTNITGSRFNDTLILATGMAESDVFIRNTHINRMVCWGASDVWFYPGCTANEIVISRTDGPCIIHWLGDKDSMPKFIFRPGSDSNSKVVDKDGNQLLPKDDNNNNNSSGNGGGGHVDRNVVYFNPQNGQSVTSKKIDENGLVQPIETPTKQGYVFGGWYEDKEGTSRFIFTNKATAGMTLYARWFTQAEWDVIQDMNDTVSTSTFRIQAETDILATVGAQNIPCSIKSFDTNQKALNIQLVRTDTDEVVAQINRLAPGQTATTMDLVGTMPAYGNYNAKLVVTPEGETSSQEIDAMLYVAYAWDRG